MSRYVLPLLLSLLAFAPAAEAGPRVAWRALVAAPVVIHTQPGFPILCDGEPIDWVGVVLSIDGQDPGNLVLALCTYDDGHEAACECASWEPGDTVAVLEVQLNYGFSSGGIEWHWIEIDRAEKIP